MPFQDAGIEMTPANRKNKNKIQLARGFLTIRNLKTTVERRSGKWNSFI